MAKKCFIGCLFLIASLLTVSACTAAETPEVVEVNPRESDCQAISLIFYQIDLAYKQGTPEPNSLSAKDGLFMIMQRDRLISQIIEREFPRLWPDLLDPDIKEMARAIAFNQDLDANFRSLRAICGLN